MSGEVAAVKGVCDERRDEGTVGDVHGADFALDACAGDDVSICGSSSDADAVGNTAWIHGHAVVGRARRAAKGMGRFERKAEVDNF